MAAVGSGINLFMGKLQDIFKTIFHNSKRMETVVNEVRESVMTSNSSVSDLSALTEEHSATMQEMTDNAALINYNTESVAGEVNQIAERTTEINNYTKEMKGHADSMESAARSNMESTGTKVNEILEVLYRAIEDSQSRGCSTRLCCCCNRDQSACSCQSGSCKPYPADQQCCDSGSA